MMFKERPFRESVLPCTVLAFIVGSAAAGYAFAAGAVLALWTLVVGALAYHSGQRSLLELHEDNKPAGATSIRRRALLVLYLLGLCAVAGIGAFLLVSALV